MWCADRRIAAAMLCLTAGGVAGAADLSSLVVVPDRGQSAEQTRRDRYECHNWAVGQTGAAPVRADPESDRDSARARRVDKVLLGAAIGAAVGGFVRSGERRHGRDEVADGALGGAVLGAAAGAIAGQRSERDAADAGDPNSDYLRALGACLEGRGYSLNEPADD